MWRVTLKHSRRSFENALEDKILLLYIFNTLKSIPSTRYIQKLVFLIYYNGLAEKEPMVFHYRFFNWNEGPYSKDLIEDIYSLLEMNLITIDEENLNYKITEEGRQRLNESLDFVPSEKIKLIEEYLTAFGKLSEEELVPKVVNIDIVKHAHKGKIIIA